MQKQNATFQPYKGNPHSDNVITIVQGSRSFAFLRTIYINKNIILKLHAAFISRSKETCTKQYKPETSLDLLLSRSYHFEEYFEA
jgi:hypothetical protein